MLKVYGLRNEKRGLSEVKWKECQFNGKDFSGKKEKKKKEK